MLGVVPTFFFFWNSPGTGVYVCVLFEQREEKDTRLVSMSAKTSEGVTHSMPPLLAWCERGNRGSVVVAAAVCFDSHFIVLPHLTIASCL